MGFYGNIKDVEKNSSFVFDKIYESRSEMDSSASTDKVYVGRYVLVDYDSSSASSLDYKKVYLNTSDSTTIGGYVVLYNSTDYNDVNRVLFEPEAYEVSGKTNAANITYDSLVYTINKNGQNEYYQCVGYVIFEEFQYDVDDEVTYEGTVYTENGVQMIEDATRYVSELKYRTSVEQAPTRYALFTRVVEGISTYSTYAKNYNADVAYAKKYGIEITGHGWDSTVWQKTLVNGIDKYVMVAELNTVVPTFDITADAPTQMPLKPHFDSASTDVYYKLHWQPQWGMRMQLADATHSTAEPINKSDSTTTWIREIYNKDTDTVSKYYLTKNKVWKEFSALDEIGDDGKLPAAIYFNKAGFDPQNRYHSSGDDIFSLSSTGYSQTPDENGNWANTQYNGHNGFGTIKEAVDTQEMAIVLPSIGNAISDMWDIVYGTGYEDGEELPDDVSKGRLTDISWSDTPITGKGRRLQLVQTENNESFDYKVSDVETLAGAINSVHDLMGMIIKEDNVIIDKNDTETSQGKKLDKKLQEFAEKADGDYIYLIQAQEEEKTTTKDAEGNETTTSKLTPISNKFYRKAAQYNIEELKANEYKYELVENLTKNNYNTWTYYTRDKDSDGNELDTYSVAEGAYKEGTDYYVRKVEGGIEIVNIKGTDEGKGKLDTFEDVMKENGNYFYKDGQDNYIYDKTYHKDKLYYTIDIDKIVGTTTPDNAVNLDATTYAPSTYYYKQDDDYILDLSTPYPYSSVEYKIKLNTDGSSTAKEYDSRKIYRPNMWFEKVSDKTDGEIYQLDSAGFDDKKQYYTVVLATSGSDIANKGNGTLVYSRRVRRGITVERDGQKRTVYDYRIIKDAEKKTETVYTQYAWSDGEKYYTVENNVEITVDANGSFTESSEFYYPDNPIYVEYKGSIDSIIYNSSTEPIFYGYNPSDNTNGYMSANNLYILTPVNDLVTDIQQQDYYWLVDNNYKKIKLHNELSVWNATDAEAKKCWTVSFEPASTQLLYQSGIYYYRNSEDATSSWYFDKAGPYTEGRKYYLIPSNAIKVAETLASIMDDKMIYEPGKYYYKSNNRYYIDNNATATEGREYYYGSNDFYVAADSGGILPLYSHWNTELPVIHSIKIGKLKDTTYTMEELVGFARTLNTIHGLILQINNFLEYGNEITRNTATVQGTLNLLNDIIAKFDILDYGQFVVTDSYGRMHTAPVEEDRWIESYINPDVNNPTVHIHHTETNAEPDENEFDFNNKQVDEIVIHQLTSAPLSEETQEKISALEKDYQDAVTEAKETYADNTEALQQVLEAVETEYIAAKKNLTYEAEQGYDSAGHILNTEKLTITLPYGFKTIKSDDTNSSYVAKNTQDTIAITTSDNWLKTSVNADSGIVIAHEVAQKATTTKGLTQAATPNFGDSFVVPEIGIDDKGHTASLTEYSVTLPKVTITPAKTGNIVTGITINSISGVITEIKTNAGDIALGTYTTEVNNDDLINTDTISNAFNKLAARLTTEVTNRASADTEIRKDFASADDTVRGEFAAADTSLKTTLENKISTEVTALNNTISSNKSSLETADSNLSSRITELENLNIKSTYATITTVNNLTNRVSTLEGYDIPNTYLSSSTAASTYLTQSDAKTTYLTIPSGDSYVLKSDYDALEKRVATLEETVEKLTSSSESETTT